MHKLLIINDFNFNNSCSFGTLIRVSMVWYGMFQKNQRTIT
nr:MAG TPA: hypothetical protein [Caudoviricetes sp.]